MTLLIGLGYRVSTFDKDERYNTKPAPYQSVICLCDGVHPKDLCFNKLPPKIKDIKDKQEDTMYWTKFKRTKISVTKPKGQSIL